jgi:Putative zinc-finger
MSVIDISCLEVWREISNYIDGEIDAELRVRMEAHFRTCAHCKAVLQGTQNVVKLIGDDVVFEIPEGAASGKPNYVIIYGDGCFNSKRQARRTVSLYEKYRNRVNFAVVDLDRNRTPAQQRLVKDYYQG